MNWFVFGGSLAAILMLTGTVWAFRLGWPGALDAASAKHEAEQAVAGFEAVDAAVSRDGQAALVAGRQGNVLVRSHGAHYVVRPLVVPELHVEGDRLIVHVGEAIFGDTTLDLGADEAARWARRLGS